MDDRKKESTSRKILISNLPEKIDIEEMKEDLFYSQNFKVSYVAFNGNAAQVTLADNSEAKRAAKLINGQLYRGQRISVSFSSLTTTSSGYLIVVGNLPFDYSEEQFRKLMSPHGEIKRSFLVRSQSTGHSKGYGFVEYVSKDCADKVKDHFTTTNAKFVNNRIIRVDIVSPNLAVGKEQHSKTLFIDHLPKGFDDDEYLRSLFSKTGTVTFCKVAIHPSTGLPRGFAFVDYYTIEEAEQSQEYHDGAAIRDSNIRVAFCTPGKTGREIFGKFAEHVTNNRDLPPGPRGRGNPVFHPVVPGMGGPRGPRMSVVIGNSHSMMPMERISRPGLPMMLPRGSIRGPRPFGPHMPRLIGAESIHSRPRFVIRPSLEAQGPILRVPSTRPNLRVIRPKLQSDNPYKYIAKNSTKTYSSKSKLSGSPSSKAKETSSSSKDSKSGSRDSKFTSRDSKSTSRDSKSTSRDSKSTSRDSKSASKDSKSASKDSKSSSKDSKSASKDSQSASKDSQSASKDSQSASKDSQSASKDSQSASKDSQSASKDSQSASKDSQSASKDSKSASKEQKTEKESSPTVALSELQKLGASALAAAMESKPSDTSKVKVLQPVVFMDVEQFQQFQEFQKMMQQQKENKESGDSTVASLEKPVPTSENSLKQKEPENTEQYTDAAAEQQPTADEQKHESTLQKPVLQKPALQKPVLQKPVLQKPALQKPALQKPALQKPALQKPALQKPALQKPALQKPASYKTSSQKPAPASQHLPAHTAKETQRQSPQTQRQSPQTQRPSPQTQRPSPQTQRQSPQTQHHERKPSVELSLRRQKPQPQEEQRLQEQLQRQQQQQQEQRKIKSIGSYDRERKPVTKQEPYHDSTHAITNSGPTSTSVPPLQPPPQLPIEAHLLQKLLQGANKRPLDDQTDSIPEGKTNQEYGDRRGQFNEQTRVESRSPYDNRYNNTVQSILKVPQSRAMPKSNQQSLQTDYKQQYQSSEEKDRIAVPKRSPANDRETASRDQGYSRSRYVETPPQRERSLGDSVQTPSPAHFERERKEDVDKYSRSEIQTRREREASFPVREALSAFDSTPHDIRALRDALVSRDLRSLRDIVPSRDAVPARGTLPPREIIPPRERSARDMPQRDSFASRDLRQREAALSHEPIPSRDTLPPRDAMMPPRDARSAGEPVSYDREMGRRDVSPLHRERDPLPPRYKPADMAARVSREALDRARYERVAAERHEHVYPRYEREPMDVRYPRNVPASRESPLGAPRGLTSHYSTEGPMSKRPRY